MTLVDAPPVEHPRSLPSQEPAQSLQAPSRAPAARASDLTRQVRVALGLIAALIGLGIIFVTPDGTGLFQAIDSRLSAALHVGGWRTMADFLAPSSPILALLLALVVAVASWPAWRSFSRSARPVVITAWAGLVAWVPAVVVRRPSPGHLGDLTAANAMSFPSISAAMLTALVLATVANPPAGLRRSVWILGILVVSASVAARLTTAGSWPIDELAGVLVGAVVARCALPRRRRLRPMRRLRPVRWRAAVAVLVGLATLLVPAGWSYLGLLTAPGGASFDQRTVEWLRDNGFSGLVDRGESWWLWRHLPSPNATISELPAPPVRITATAGARLPTPLPSIIEPALPGEGRWEVAAVDQSGEVQMATTYFRPDPGHPSLVAAAAWIHSSTTRVTLIAGTRQPGGGPGPAGGHVPDAALASLIAVFNSGYKLKDTPGGTLIEGRSTRVMVDGLATLAVRADGTATVGEWGADVGAAQGYTGLRQNLHLMVRDGAVVDGVATNVGGRWGTVRNALPTWRSGLGVTASGDLVFVAGNNLTLGVLGDALVHAGARAAMELDIHNGMVTFNLFTHEPGPVGHKLLPDMTRPADRYLTTDWRDFVMITAR